MDTWLEKYRPNTLDDYLDYNTQYRTILDPWITAYNNHRLARQHYFMHKPFILLIGEPGVGKTTLAHCLFNSHKYVINECNASSTRTKSGLDQMIKTGKLVAGNDMRLHNVGVIMDEIDGLSVNESNGVNALLDIVLLSVPPTAIAADTSIIKNKTSNPNSTTKSSSQIYRPRYPMIMTANSVKERKFKRIIDMSIVVNVKSPSPAALLELSSRINNSESIGLTNTDLTQLIESLGRVADYRIVIQQLWHIHHSIQYNKHIHPNNIPQPTPQQFVKKTTYTLSKLSTSLDTINNNPTDSDNTNRSNGDNNSTNDLALFNNAIDGDNTKSVSLDNQITRQLLYIGSMDIQKAMAAIISHRPKHLELAANDPILSNKFRDGFYIQLEHIINTDPNLFHLSIWENYSSVISQIYLAVFKCRSRTLNRKEIVYALWSSWKKITQCYSQCAILENQIAVTRDWNLQPYNVYLGALTSIRLLNELNNIYYHSAQTKLSDNTHGWLSDNTIKIDYHTRYNAMKQDSAHLCNNLLFRTVVIPGDHNIASKDLISNKPLSKHKQGIVKSIVADPDATYDPMLDIARYDSELFYIMHKSNNTAISSVITKYGITGQSVIKKLDKVYKKLTTI